MSYDIYWHRRKETIDGTESAYDENGDRIEGEIEDNCLNITSNLRKMFSWAFGVDYWCDAVEGKTGKEIEPLVYAAVKKMITEQQTAETYNSPNGWGIYPHALRFLKQLLEESIRYPEHYIYISK